MNKMKFEHTPVLYRECIENLNIKPHGIYVDLTLGKGGHSKMILENLSSEGLLIGIDQDEAAIKAASENLKDYDNKVFFNTNFENIARVLTEAGFNEIDGALMDIGVSSYQIDNPDRGFSYMHDGPLDMRMNTKSELTAEDIVSDYSQDELTRIFFDYGEERHSKAIARNIVKARENERINTTFKLRNIVMKSAKFSEAHPEKRVFQALRIEVNRELDVLTRAIDTIVDFLDKDARLAIISFHSLEDRIVKNKFKELATSCICPPELPVCVCNHKAKVKVLTKKPITAQADELKENSRSKPAKLRVCQRI